MSKIKGPQFYVVANAPAYSFEQPCVGYFEGVEEPGVIMYETEDKYPLSVARLYNERCILCVDPNRRATLVDTATGEHTFIGWWRGVTEEYAKSQPACKESTRLD